MLASSNDLRRPRVFLDQIELMELDQEGIAVAEYWTELPPKAELERQQTEVTVKQDNLRAQQQDLENRKAELQRAINGNNAEQAQFAADKNAATQERKRLSALQSEIMWALRPPSSGGITSPNKGGYPYQKDCPGRLDEYMDEWRMYVCECVSYTAWKVSQYYGLNVRGIGRSGSYNAKYWDDNFSGIVPMGKTPRARSVAVWEGGPYGHVAWVEYVSGSTVWVSEYNYKYGDYYERDASKTGSPYNASEATYIYFDQY